MDDSQTRNKEIFEQKLKSNYNMTLEQFRELDDYTKDKLIRGMYIIKDKSNIKEANDLKTEDILRAKAKIANLVIDKVHDIAGFERNFIDDFGMTLDQFEKLDYSEQKKLIERVSILNKKKKKILRYSKKNEKMKKKNIFKKN